MDHILYLIIVGGVAGWLAGLVMKGKGYGIVVNIVLGIIGGIVGGWLFGLLQLQAAGLVGSIITALVGAVVVIYLARMFKS